MEGDFKGNYKPETSQEEYFEALKASYQKMMFACFQNNSVVDNEARAQNTNIFNPKHA